MTNTKRVSGLVGQGITKRVNADALSSSFDTWGGSWGTSWGSSWGGVSSMAQLGLTVRVATQALAAVTKRVAGVIGADNTARVATNTMDLLLEGDFSGELLFEGSTEALVLEGSDVGGSHTKRVVI